MSLRNFLSSRAGKRFYNFCYCWGACLVILGAISKIGDFPYGNILLGIGLYTEVFIFFISGFDEPPREYKWERVFPILNDKQANTDPKVASVNFKLSGNGENYKQEMAKLEENVRALNETHEAQLKQVKQQMDLLNKQYKQMQDTMNVKTTK